MKIFLRVLLIAIFLGLVAYSFYFLYSKNKQEPIVYETQTAITTDIIKKTVATGSVVPREEIDIKPQVSGIIDELYVEAGEMIEKDALIAKVKVIPNMVSLNNAENRVNTAKLRLDNAKRDYDRNKKLFDDGVIALAEYQQFELAYGNAQEEMDAANNNLQIVKEGATKKAGASSNTLIRSTVSGMVLDVPVKLGNQVIESNTFNEGTTIASVADMGEMIFEGKIDESEVGKIKEGMDLMLTIGAIEGATFEAKLEYISPKGVEENGAIQFEIKAQVQLKEDNFIRAGYSANAAIVLDKREQVLAINERLLQFDPETQGTYVEVEIGDQVYERRDVKTGLSDGINVEILSGLTLEDKIKVPSLR